MSSELKGSVIAVSMSPDHGYPTYPQQKVTITEEGIPGDAHSGPLRDSFTKPGTLKPNDRPISIVADEVRREMNKTFGIDMQPGDFNEQVLVEGLGDLSDVPIGSTVLFDSGVSLMVTDTAFPCVRLEAHNGAPGMMRDLLIPRGGGKPLSRRGILARVIQGGDLMPGVGIEINRPTATE